MLFSQVVGFQSKESKIFIHGHCLIAIHDNSTISAHARHRAWAF